MYIFHNNDVEPLVNSGAFSFQGNSCSDIIQLSVLGLSCKFFCVCFFVCFSVTILLNYHKQMIVYLHDFCTGHPDMSLDYFC